MGSIQTFNEVINGFCCSDKVHRAMALLTQMLGAGFSPNIVTFNSLISGQCSAGEMKISFLLLDLMEEYDGFPDLTDLCHLYRCSLRRR